MNCLQHFRFGNTHQRTVLTALFELRSGHVQSRSFLMEMHPVAHPGWPVYSSAARNAI
jgi:hypothetical protein